MMEYVLETADSETPFTLHLGEFYHDVTRDGRDFTEAFHEAVLNHLVYSDDGGTEPDYEPIVYSSYLDVDGLSSYVQVFVDEGAVDGWLKLAQQFEDIISYQLGLSWLDDDRLIAYLSLVDENGWRWMDIDANGIKESMLGYVGTFGSKWEGLEDIMQNDHTIEAVFPSWLAFDADATADNAEEEGLFSSTEVGYFQVAIWR